MGKMCARRGRGWVREGENKEKEGKKGRKGAIF